MRVFAGGLVGFAAKHPLAFLLDSLLGISSAP